MIQEIPPPASPEKFKTVIESSIWHFGKPNSGLPGTFFFWLGRKLLPEFSSGSNNWSLLRITRVNGTIPYHSHHFAPLNCGRSHLPSFMQSPTSPPIDELDPRSHLMLDHVGMPIDFHRLSFPIGLVFGGYPDFFVQPNLREKNSRPQNPASPETFTAGLAALQWGISTFKVRLPSDVYMLWNKKTKFKLDKRNPSQIRNNAMEWKAS